MLEYNCLLCLLTLVAFAKKKIQKNKNEDITKYPPMIQQLVDPPLEVEVVEVIFFYMTFISLSHHCGGTLTHSSLQR